MREARIILLKLKSDHITLLLKTPQWLSTSVGVQAVLPRPQKAHQGLPLVRSLTSSQAIFPWLGLGSTCQGYFCLKPFYSLVSSARDIPPLDIYQGQSSSSARSLLKCYLSLRPFFYLVPNCKNPSMALLTCSFQNEYRSLIFPANYKFHWKTTAKNPHAFNTWGLMLFWTAKRSTTF